MSVVGLDELLAGHELFRGLDPDYVALVAGCGRNVVFEPGAVISHDGDRADQFYLVRRGRVSLQLSVPGRGSIVIETIDPGEVLGWSWIVAPHRWQFDAVAVELTRAVAFDGACLRAKFDADPRLGYELLQRFVGIVAERLRATRIRLLDLYGPGG